MSPKYLSLAALAVQNSALALVMRQSRTTDGPRYISSTAVIISEMIKTVLSLVILLLTSVSNHDDKKTQGLSVSTRMFQEVLVDIRIELARSNNLIPIMIPAILYTVQNNLQYLAAANLDAATFSVLYQGKILTTALFAVILLRRNLDSYHWTGLFVLSCGIVLISFPTGPNSSFSGASSVEGQMIGLLAVLSACLTSGFAGTFVEFLLKKAKNAQPASNVSQLWTRNVQLSAAGVVMACGIAVCIDRDKIVQQGFFLGYNQLVWTTILLQAVGGLVVALAVTYADNILKGFATSLSLVASTSISVVMGDCVLTQRFVFGVLLVLSATQIYVLGQEGKAPTDMRPSKKTLDVHTEDKEKNAAWTTVDESLTREVAVYDKRPMLGERTKSAP